MAIYLRDKVTNGSYTAQGLTTAPYNQGGEYKGVVASLDEPFSMAYACQAGGVIGALTAPNELYGVRQAFENPQLDPRTVLPQIVGNNRRVYTMAGIFGNTFFGQSNCTSPCLIWSKGLMRLITLQPEEGMIEREFEGNLNVLVLPRPIGEILAGKLMHRSIFGKIHDHLRDNDVFPIEQLARNYKWLSSIVRENIIPSMIFMQKDAK